MEMTKQHQKKEEKKKNEDSKLEKLPNLVISKFEVKNLNWLRFLTPFKTEIDKEDHSQSPDQNPVTKNFYLMEFKLLHV